MLYVFAVIFCIVSISLFIWVFAQSIREGVEEFRVREMLRDMKSGNKSAQQKTQNTPLAEEESFHDAPRKHFPMQAEAEPCEPKEAHTSAPTVPQEMPVSQPQQAPSKPSSDVKKPTEAPPAARQTPPTGIPSAAKRTPPTQKPAPQPVIGVIKVPKVRVDPAFFTPELATKYKERGSSLRLGRALTQGMLLEHLKTDKTVTPHEASATVHSLHSGLSYQTTLTKCSCPDHQKRGEPCKHMLALAVYVKAITLDESSQP